MSSTSSSVHHLPNHFAQQYQHQCQPQLQFTPQHCKLTYIKPTIPSRPPMAGRGSMLFWWASVQFHSGLHGPPSPCIDPPPCQEVISDSIVLGVGEWVSGKQSKGSWTGPGEVFGKGAWVWTFENWPQHELCAYQTHFFYKIDTTILGRKIYHISLPSETLVHLLHTQCWIQAFVRGGSASLGNSYVGHESL